MKEGLLTVKNGSVHESNSLGKFRVVDFISSINIEIEFIDTGYRCFSTAQKIRNGMVKDLLKPISFGVGYLGEGAFFAQIDGDKTKAYTAWRNMPERCYSKTDRATKLFGSYKGCTVCTDWHSFQVFAKWFWDGYSPGLVIDKDIKTKGNRVYCPEHCTFVTVKENSIDASAKSYLFKDPSGNSIEIYNLSEFCRENNLRQSHMTSVSTGARRHHKGWTISPDSNGED